ncbi:YdcF family protein [Phormidium tenue FACHB-886]|nr:YdcF family protein [Phormidium tenue FACHB-886]
MRSTSVSAAHKRPSLLKRFIRVCRKSLIALVALILLGLGYKQLESFLHPPQAVLVLGGSIEREKFAASFAQAHPDLPVWISSGSNPEYAEWVFQEAGISPERLHLDYRAVDTVTNFTTLVDQFKAQDIHSIYLITSDYHMRRASVIGEIVLGSRGIDFRTVEVPSQRSPEPLNKAIRDGARAVLWVATGSTGSSFANVLSQK